MKKFYDIDGWFPSDTKLYHVGYQSYAADYGIIASDNSFLVGIPFLTSKEPFTRPISDAFYVGLLNATISWLY
jgi:hypothetical protein